MMQTSVFSDAVVCFGDVTLNPRKIKLPTGWRKNGAICFTACNFINIDRVGTKFGTNWVHIKRLFMKVRKTAKAPEKK